MHLCASLYKYWCESENRLECMCSKSIWIQDVPKAFLHTRLIHPLFERRTSVNERMCMLFRLDHTCTVRVYRVFLRFARHDLFFPSCDIFETFCTMYRSLFHRHLSPHFSKIHTSWSDLAIIYHPGSLLGVLTRLQNTEKSRFVSANREV